VKEVLDTEIIEKEFIIAGEKAVDIFSKAFEK
jgi:hypothetical protein